MNYKFKIQNVNEFNKFKWIKLINNVDDWTVLPFYKLLRSEHVQSGGMLWGGMYGRCVRASGDF